MIYAKCKHCDGTGTTNWCINGTFVDCPYCGGSGEMEVEQTNEEWFCSLTTEEKARFIDNILTCCFDENAVCENCKLHDKNCDYKGILEWLKQPHREE